MRFFKIYKPSLRNYFYYYYFCTILNIDFLFVLAILNSN